MPGSTDDCDFQCDSLCPPGFDCRAGFCVHPGFAGTCPGEGGEPAASEDVGRGKEPRGPNACPTGTETLTLSPVEPIRACVGQDVDVLLAVTGGARPYSWFSSPEVPGLVLEQNSSPRARLTGTLASAGTSQLEVGVLSGTSCTNFQVNVDVAGAPEITTVFPDACVGQPFELALAATGGDPDSYSWKVDGVPELHLEGARLSGNAPSESGQRQVLLSVRDDRCPAAGDDPVNKIISWNVKGAGQCPRVTTTALPAPCAGVPYSELLGASDGSGSGYRWSVLGASLPEGLAFDAEHGVLQGTLSGPGRDGFLDVLLTDSTDQQAVARFDLQARADCTLAYVAEEPARLYVRDVSASAASIELPLGLSVEEEVLELQFSPDGAWIAFRAGAPGRERLYLYPTSLPHASDATLVQFECPSAPCGVLDYAWSSDSRALAAVLSGATSEQDYVTGVNVAAPAEPWPIQALALRAGSAVAADYLRDLAWSPEGNFGYVGSSGEPGTPETIYWAPAGLAMAPQAAQFSDTELHLRAVRSGWVAFDGFSYSTTALRSPDALVLLGVAWTSPSGLYAAAASPDAQLSLFSLDQLEPLAVTEPGVCEVVVAWSRGLDGAERIACSKGSIDAPSGEDLSVFDYLPAQQRFEPGAGRRLPVNGSYVPAPLGNTRRVFSPAADWLLVGAPAAMALAPLPASTPSLPRPIDSISVAGHAEVEFTPDGHFLLVYDDHGLRRSPVPAGLGGAFLSEDAQGNVLPPAALSTCEEALWASPDNWCGAPRSLSHFAISSDSKSVLLETGDGGLWLSDLSAAPQRPAQRLAARLGRCAGACPGVRYAFAAAAPQP
ncbi:MAG: hypothetical protein ABI895_05340 [Deltaproteobacteria bacterium]